MATTIDFQVFTTVGAFTWTKPANAKVVFVLGIGGGSGGGSGRRGAAGTARGGGGGGSGGPCFFWVFNPADLAATEGGQIAAGGAGGAAVTANDTNGNNGTAGGYTVFGTGNKASCIASWPGNGGTTAGGNGGLAIDGMFPSSAGRPGGAGGATPPTTVGLESYGTGSGGGGGGISAGDVAQDGSNGGRTWNGVLNASIGGIVDTYAPSTPVVGGAFTPGQGGGGGYASKTAAAAAGANGGLYGGGGGGGGASLNGFNSGKGGDGASGCVVVMTICST